MTRKRPAGNLPADVTGFVGRRQELSQARRLLADTRMLTLIGLGGVGKTRLALRVAAEARRAFRDGVWLVDLAPLQDGELLPRAVADALGLRDESSQRPLSGLAEFLEDKQLLLVLDGCEHLTYAAAMLAGKLLGAAPGLRILATSREILGVEGEQVLSVPPLAVPEPGQPWAALTQSDAVRLFAERGAAVLNGFTVTEANAESVTALCRRLEGIPLAIELAAARLRALSVRQILDRLDIRTPAYRTSVPRHQTMRAAIGWSYDLCTPQERTLWARLSVFSGEFDLEAAEHVCSGDGLPQEQIFDLVASLLDKSILVRGEYVTHARYRLLEIVRQYGSNVLVESGEEMASRRRHRDHFRDLAERAEADWFGPRQAEWVARLRHEHTNLRAALDFCLREPGEARHALEIVAALWNYWVFFAGSFGEGRHWLERALELDAEPTAARVKALWVDAWFALRQADLTAATPLLDECRELARRLDDRVALAFVAHFSGLTAYLRGDTAGAIGLLREARDRHAANGDQDGVWMTLFHLVIAYSSVGDDGRADSLAAECLAMCEARSAYLSKSNALWVVGLARWFRGEQDRASALVRSGLKIMRSLDDRWGVAACLEVLAWVEAADGRDERAARLFGAAGMVWQAMGTSLPALRPFAEFHNLCETQLRLSLGQSGYSAAFRRGVELTADQAVDYALETGARAPAPRQEAEPEEAAALTPRQREVAALIAEGLSNKDIAAKLVIAQRTAEGHVESILTKLGFTSRVQIAAWVSSHR
ncbi:LuxR C-terminal-related transcriptional regulator [Nonomuraea sp. B19D2]|uniref:ATP-binding protein n=1 Tax=Nonomuraea sp. B19D2 TaxID=3159561 RepID=UPI0032DA881D